MKRDSRVVDVKKRLKLKISTSFWRKRRRKSSVKTAEKEEE